MRTVRLTVQYAGTAYCGWQVQPGRPTIQGTIEAALARVVPEPSPRLHGAGRTDAGVHARAQVAHFETILDLPADRLQAALNHFLPWDVRVLQAVDAPSGFHARSSALSKEYRYRVYRGEVVPPEVYAYTLLVRGRLDAEAMRTAAAAFVGTHDFAALRCAGSRARTTVRTVLRSEWLDDGAELVYRIEADGFLYKMVRTIVGSLIEVGRHRRPAASIAELLRSRDRNQAGRVVPAKGLHLWTVNYAVFGEDATRP